MNNMDLEIFRTKLKEHAEKHNLELTSINGWTEPKIKWMALNDEKCCCKPETRHCPCEESLDEIRHTKRHMCVCSVFTAGTAFE